MAKYTVKEDGNNGSVEVTSDAIIRTHAKRLGRDDHVRIPMRTVESVRLDRQVGGDVVTIVTGDATYDWKLSDDDAKRLVDELATHGKS